MICNSFINVTGATRCESRGYLRSSLALSLSFDATYLMSILNEQGPISCAAVTSCLALTLTTIDMIVQTHLNIAEQYLLPR